MWLQITYERTDAGDPSGAILEDAHYKRVNMAVTLYNWQLAVRKSYDNIIVVDNPLFHTKEENWAAGMRNHARKHAT